MAGTIRAALTRAFSRARTIQRTATAMVVRATETIRLSAIRRPDASWKSASASRLSSCPQSSRLRGKKGLDHIIALNRKGTDMSLSPRSGGIRLWCWLRRETTRPPGYLTILLTFGRGQPGLSGTKCDGPAGLDAAIPVHPGSFRPTHPIIRFRYTTPAKTRREAVALV